MHDCVSDRVRLTRYFQLSSSQLGIMPRNDYTTDQLFDSDALIKEVTSSKPMQSRQDEFLLTPGELGWDQNNQYFHDSEQQQRFFACALATLQDPHKQNCRRRLLGFLSVISKCIDEEGLLPFFVEHNRSALRFHQQPFLRALAGWVLEPRSKTECERLLYCLEETPEGLEHCALHCDDLEDGLIASVHSLGELQFGRERAIPKHFFSILSAVLYVATEEKKTAKVAKRVKAAIKEQGLESLDSSWPRDISDVSCVSIDDGIAQMATWIDAFPINPDVYAILASLMALYPHQVILRVEQHQSICLHALTNLKMINEVLQPEQRYYSNEDLLIMLAHIARFYDAVLNDLNHSNLIKLVSPPVELLRGAGFGEVDRYQKQLVLICGVFIDVIPEILAGSNTQSGTGGYEAKAKACINTFERLGRKA
ncbi:hypothetical protein BDP27DRAFT_1403821 [Rhodocollybia butyracea]|uniref:Uncharacterized protein n=1 Tax=Rhodocollybia butyracea TaxID=206335 RepID=A0A9P5PKS0_9AGAR|nr:hypothetical protein BDP27DRAFT_1403821 [Rhodocollybia butyracea]